MRTKKTEQVNQAQPLAVDAMADEVRKQAIERAAEALASKILAEIDRKEQVTAMRRESIAGARAKLAENRAAKRAASGAPAAERVTAEGAPSITTEMRPLQPPSGFKIRRRGAKNEVAAPAQPAAETATPASAS